MADDGIALSWIGLDKFKAAIDGIAARMAVETRGAVAEAAHLIEAKAKANFEGSHAKRMPHEGGSKPNVVTGNLRRSIHVEGPTGSGMSWSAKVGPSAVYGRAIELGLRQNRLVKYPYFRPGFEEAVPEIAEIFHRHALAAITRS
ncbi:MAG: HK97 gp10 family phage protein [Solirubrobacteraceae bacterium]